MIESKSPDLNINESLDNLDFIGVETDLDKDELFGERLALSSFQIRTAISLYEKDFVSSKINKIFFSFPKFFGLVIFSFLIINIIFASFSSNIFNPNESENILYNSIAVFLLLFLIGYALFLRKKQKMLLFKSFSLTIKNIYFFQERINRFNFIQYLNQNKSEFPLVENNEDFKLKIKQLKAMDKNNDYVGFTLLVLYLYGCDIPVFYQRTIIANSLNYQNNKDMQILFSYLNTRIEESKREVIQ